MGGEFGGLLVASEALAAGTVTRRQLRRDFVKLYRNIYARSDVELDAKDRAMAAWLWSGRDATVAGSAASALLGARWVPPSVAVELVRHRRVSPPGVIVHTDDLAQGEVVMSAGIPCTSPARTAFDIGRRLPQTVAIARIDSLLRATRCSIAEVELLADRHRGVRGMRRLRSALALADAGAESPQESRTRLLLMRAGLPRPCTQVEVFDESGWLVARIDLGWREWRVGVEYDGTQHWTDPNQHARDIERLEQLAMCGWRIVRVSATQLREFPGLVVERTRRALREAGCPQA